MTSPGRTNTKKNGASLGTVVTSPGSTWFYMGRVSWRRWGRWRQRHRGPAAGPPDQVQ